MLDKANNTTNTYTLFQYLLDNSINNTGNTCKYIYRYIAAAAITASEKAL